LSTFVAVWKTINLLTMNRNITLLLCLGFLLGFTSYAAETPYYATKAKTAPIIDANLSDSCWNKAEWKSIDQAWIGSAVKSPDFEGKFKVVWTPEKLYFLVEITDDNLNIGYPGNCNNIYNFDCIEIFLDEDHSGGDHQYNYNAFAYHIAANGDVCDNGTDKTWHLFKNDVESKFDTLSDNVYCWEVAVKVFADNYVYGADNTPVVLTVDKVLGLSVAYNDNDGGTQRQSMFGSAIITATDKNVSWINASYFGAMQLIEDSVKTTVLNVSRSNKVICSYNTLTQALNFNYLDDYFGSISAQLIDITGKTMKCNQIYKTNNQLNGSLQIAGLPKGVYFLRIISGRNFYTSKLAIN
jgi:hypothetical protein